MEEEDTFQILYFKECFRKYSYIRGTNEKMEKLHTEKLLNLFYDKCWSVARHVEFGMATDNKYI
jgi:hypothetical protein